MLKRTTGRFLITLLVVTGLAGTVSDNTVSKEERKYATGLMKETYRDALKATRGLSEAQLNFKAAADRWSVKDCFYHIAATEKGLWGMLEGALKSPANPEKRAEIKVTDEQFVSMIKDRSKKAQAPEPLQPKNTGYKSLDEAIADFKANRSAHIKYMKTSTEDMRNHVVQMPFGYIDCYQLYLMIAAHSNRHTQQMNEVKANAGFPAQ
ncbi:MAG TPA: DinB family protein [Chitinophagaceae bacterium]|nr:DinB family protein [Chitinophagaceae bacterium]